MPGHNIICPYCFEQFEDDQVHFRMETVFSEEKLDPKNEGRTKGEIEVDRRFPSDEIKAQIAEYSRREAFLKQEDPLYESFWQEFGGTTEKSSVSRDGKVPKVMPYQRPVFDPFNPQHTVYFGEPNKPSDVVNESGMVYAAVDCFGRKTQRRVCPRCHNPLPGAYGKYPVKFVSVIGITGAGKTVYLSQLCKYISDQISNFNITSNPTSIYAREYLESNPVLMGKELPVGSPPEQLLQPLCFDLVYRRDGVEMYHTIVFYDIAGENCVDPERMQGFGRFVEHSNGIILLIDPDQFSGKFDGTQPVKVLETIFTVFQNHNADQVRNLPIAVCISKGDKIAMEMIQQNLNDIQFLQDNYGYFQPRFNTDDYNPIHDAINSFVQRNNSNLHVRMRILYDNYNYFIFSAIGTSTVKIDGTDLDTPAGPPIPKRIMEPVVWLLYKFKFINSHGEIHEPKDWICNTCGKRCRVDQKYCPTCKTNNEGKWECPRCHTEQTNEWCTTKGCRTNRLGKRKGLFSS